MSACRKRRGSVGEEIRLNGDVEGHVKVIARRRFMCFCVRAQRSISPQPIHIACPRTPFTLSTFASASRRLHAMALADQDESVRIAVRALGDMRNSAHTSSPSVCTCARLFHRLPFS